MEILLVLAIGNCLESCTVTGANLNICADPERMWCGAVPDSSFVIHFNAIPPMRVRVRVRVQLRNRFRVRA